MAKINLLVSESDLNSFCSTWFSDVLKDKFNLIYHEHTTNHSPADTICVTNFLNSQNQWYLPFVQSGYKLIVDHFWDSNIEETSVIKNSTLTIRNKNWLWYNESLWYRHLGYHNYVPNKSGEYAFLLLMHLIRSHRDQLKNKLENYLQYSLSSYVQRGIRLPDDLDYKHGDWQRFFNPAWYDKTCFSVVAESTITSPTWISEKTFKPIAYEHPFIIWGSTGTLKYLHSQGFETYDHIIDESYDMCESPVERLNLIVNNIDKLISEFQESKMLFNDPISKEKMKHNKERFFNKDLVVNHINDEIVTEILDFFE